MLQFKPFGFTNLFSLWNPFHLRIFSEKLIKPGIKKKSKRNIQKTKKCVSRDIGGNYMSELPKNEMAELHKIMTHDISQLTTSSETGNLW